MRSNWKKMIAMLLMVSMLLSMFILSVNAEDAAEIDTELLLAEKNAELNDDGDSWTVELAVPAAAADNSHDEVILMIDGSYSMDDEWPAMKNAIVEIGKAVLSGNGRTQLTLMAFGMGDNEVLVHIHDPGHLQQALGELPGTLLYGRSSTNCEAGFTGVAEYIDAHDDTLKDVQVVFISDGNINTDETPHNFYNWKNNTWLRFSVEAIAMENLYSECSAISAGLNRSNAFTTVFGDDADPATLMDTVTVEQAIEWIDQVWADVYAYAGMDPEVEYPVSDAERAFVAYDEAHNTYLQDCFYYALLGRSYPNRNTRTPVAANELAAHEKVTALYTVDYSGYSAWMDTGITAENAEYIQSNGIADLINAMKSTIANLAKTQYSDVVVTDYMSKWVKLDQTSIKVIDDTNGVEVYNTTQGWRVDGDARFTDHEEPVKVELVNPSEYAQGGAAVEGNVHGDIYKITWRVKDGPLLRSENYHLKYVVTADTLEPGYQKDASYPANGTTSVEYNDENGEKIVENIEVPVINNSNSAHSYRVSGKDSVTGYWCTDEACGDRNSCNHYDTISKKGNWFMYNTVTLADGESATFALQAGNNKKNDNIIGYYTITRSGDQYYTTYSITEENIGIAEANLAVSEKADFTGAPGKDDNQDYGKWFTVEGNPDIIYVFAHFTVEYYI